MNKGRSPLSLSPPDFCNFVIEDNKIPASCYNTLMQEESEQGQNWTYSAEEDTASSTLPTGGEASWTASEYIAHHKGANWYVLLGLITFGLAFLVYLVSRDVITVITIAVVAVSFGFFASRPPRTLNYKIDQNGITIGDKLYPYVILRSFSVQQEGGIRSIFLTPLKRFMPGISLYYPPDQEDLILNTISSYLPHEERQPDAIDRLMRRVRF